MPAVAVYLRAAALGAAAMYLLDHDRGRRRRAVARDRTNRALRAASRRMGVSILSVRQRLKGLQARARRTVDFSEVSDATLAARVRASLGRVVSHAHAVHIDVRQGCVTLAGPILAGEHAGLIATVRRVRGVRRIDDDALIVYERSDRVSALQGSGPRRAAEAESVKAGIPLSAIAGGALLAALGLTRRGPARVALPIAGLALAASCAVMRKRPRFLQHDASRTAPRSRRTGSHLAARAHAQSSAVGTPEGLRDAMSRSNVGATPAPAVVRRTRDDRASMLRVNGPATGACDPPATEGTAASRPELLAQRSILRGTDEVRDTSLDPARHASRRDAPSMAHLVVGIFGSREDADRARAILLQYGFQDRDITVEGRDPTGGGHTGSDLAAGTAGANAPATADERGLSGFIARMFSGFIRDDDPRTQDYAKTLARGGGIVAVHGLDLIRAREVSVILQDQGALDVQGHAPTDDVADASGAGRERPLHAGRDMPASVEAEASTTLRGPRIDALPDAPTSWNEAPGDAPASLSIEADPARPEGAIFGAGVLGVELDREALKRRGRDAPR